VFKQILTADQDRVTKGLGERMARRTDHTREELAELVVKAAEKLARREGLRGVAMRRIAAEIGYAPGSIYNAVGDLDRVILRVNARTLERLSGHLVGAVDPDRSALQNALGLADAYLAFVMRQPRLWSLLLEHALPKGIAFPSWYEEALARPTRLVDDVLKPLIPSPEERRQSVATLWAALHGLASLSTSGKLAILDRNEPRALAQLLIRRFLQAGA
jgi:AcrR family transcriptional regulator